MSADEALDKLCTEDLRSYFDVAPDNPINFQQLQTQFCSINWTVVGVEMYEDLNIKEIERAVSYPLLIH